MRQQGQKKTVHRRRASSRETRSGVLLDLVQKNALFTNVSRRVLQHVAPHLKQHHYTRGETIFDEETKDRDLYLILTGKVHIVKYTKTGTESLLAVLHEGDFFGELSLIGDFSRSARAVAESDCTIISLAYEHYEKLLNRSRPFARNLLQRLALRLRTLDQLFVQELERKTAEFEAQVDKLHLLIEATKTVNSTINSDELLGLILTAATTSIRADRGTLYLVDPVTNELWSKVMNGTEVVEIRMPMGKGLAGYVAKTGETVNIPDAYKDPRFNPEIDKRSGYKTHNVLCMPLRDKAGTIIGVFQLLNKRGGSFTKDDEEFIQALSVHAAIALENARLVKELVQNERLSTIGRMASSIIHDIKNPMAAMRIYAQMIKAKTQNKEAAEIAEMMMKQVDRFVNMTQEILDFSRGVSDMNIEEVELGTLLPTMLQFIESDLTKKGIAVVKEFDYTGSVRMDAEKMMRVFQNLAGNAADAMPSGGMLTIRTRRCDDKLVIEFADTGTGMTEEVRLRAFEPFYTAGKKHGTGLGLAIVKKILEEHNGTVAIESAVGKGTTVRMMLPLS
jgi:CRP-like cAMP-binding protein/two-component sensor histidine kinase